MNLGLEGKVAIVTGAGGGIGRAAAVRFAEAGARLVIADIQSAAIEETAEIIRRTGAACVAMTANVALRQDVKEIVDRAVLAFGQLDCAFNNAGISQDPAYDAWDEDWWDHLMTVNFKSVMLGMKFQIKQMLDQGTGGAIVNTASVAGITGLGGMAYAASKHAVLGLTKAAAVSVAAKGIRINAICPGPIRTSMMERAIIRDEAAAARLLADIPAGRPGTAEEAADVAVWLCSERASFVVGHPLVVDGGLLAH